MKPLKDDTWKSRVDLIDATMLLELWNILRLWAEKYAENSWQGIPPNKHIAACLRHIYRYQEWEEFDPETNMSHLIHAIANLMFVNYNEKFITKEIEKWKI